jgi:C1A family cysteine protease
MKSLLVAIVLVGLVVLVAECGAAADGQSTWEAYKAKHGKQYASAAQEAKRKAIWEAKHAEIGQHNSRFAAGQETYQKGHNFMSDLTQDEKNSYKGLKRKVSASASRSAAAVESDRTTLPASYDLRNSSCLAAIKDQGQCGDCYTFSATTPIEYQYCIKYKTAVVLSEQQLTDCTYSGYDGCQGGAYEDCWSYLKSAGGQETTANYAWKAATTSKTCSFSASKVLAKVSTYTLLAQSETTMQSALVSYGPISIAIYVNTNFEAYTSGVYSDSSCPTDLKNVNHAVSVVGYGTSGSTPYWVVRNSWGTSWGQAGYILMKRGVNLCNIASDPAYPTIV